MKTKCFLSVTVLVTVTFILLACSESPTSPTGSNNNTSTGLYCYYGQYEGGCFEIQNANECDTQNGSIVTVCNNTAITPQKEAANAVILTLTYWQTKDTDAGGLDPKIHFNVKAYQNGRQVSNNNSSTLLDRQDISATWSGSERSSPIPFASQADEIRVYAVVVEKDLLVNDDISPGYYMIFHPPFYKGTTGSETLDYGSGKSMVKFNYEFVWQ